MNDILQDFSTLNLTAAIESNLFAVFSSFRQWPRAEVRDSTEMLWTMSDIPFPLFNSILRAKLPPDRIDAVISTITAQAEARNVPLLWWTGPATRPTDLGIHLERRGFAREAFMPGMAVDLAKLQEDLPMPGGLTVQRVTDDETLKQWSRVFALGFGMPDFAATTFYEFMRHVDPDTNLAYLGWQHGQPVATSLMILAAGVAGIYNVVTIPEARRQGIGAVMTQAPLRDARDRNYKVGILHASEMGVDVYRSLGFQEYCTIGQYGWSPQQKRDVG